MDRRSFLSLIAGAPVAVAAVSSDAVTSLAGPVAPTTLAGMTPRVPLPGALAVEPISAGDFVAVTPDGRWLVRADGPWPEVMGVALASASPGEMVAISVAGVACVNREG